ncbi:uncharacterized protein LOC107469586 [Arachis duranensis]|uniref:Uncharacterized protein LOC107469586 n=1 Tax=Arachis duranensis TaxID=130453 RepID=A0A6P5MVH4_ARADU|nr:uncharacterized protein LOC107469586 [Arachis duranensis]XP_029145479.1 uncharacterized protein LOC112715468 [Arachis hypogaea]
MDETKADRVFISLFSSRESKPKHPPTRPLPSVLSLWLSVALEIRFCWAWSRLSPRSQITILRHRSSLLLCSVALCTAFLVVLVIRCESKHNNWERILLRLSK